LGDGKQKQERVISLDHIWLADFLFDEMKPVVGNVSR